MFKSVFAKYVTAFMVIITLGFVLLLIIVTSIVSNYSSQAKLELMDNAAQVTKEILEQAIADEPMADFDSIVHTYEDTQLDDILNIFAEKSLQKTKFVETILHNKKRAFFALISYHDFLPFLVDNYLYLNSFDI